MSEQIIDRPTPINEEVSWDKTRTIISTTDRAGIITDVNQAFVDTCEYSPAELLGKPHNIVRHPDMPKIIFKILWDNIAMGRNFHAIVKNLTKSGKYYWGIVNFEVGRNILGEVVTIMAKRKAVPENVIKDHIEPLYATLLKLEKIGDMELSNRYFKGFLEKQGKSYIGYIMDIMDQSKREVYFEPVINIEQAHTELVATDVSDVVFAEQATDLSPERKSFFEKLFATT